MMKLVLTVIGGLLGAALSYVNRPKYLGGLADPIKDSLSGPSVDKGAMNDWLPMLATYTCIGAVIGLVLGILIGRASSKTS